VDQSALGWIIPAIAIVVFLDLLVVELRRVAREGMRIVTRVLAWGDLPVLAQAGRAGDDLERIALAIDQVSPLLERARVALTTIRYPRGQAPNPPFVPNGSDASNGFAADWSSGGSQVQP
jgi:hypothetical protein